MKLYNCYNGFMGNDYVHVSVIAENEKRAKELAVDELKKHRQVKDAHWLRITDITVECEDTSNEWTSEVLDKRRF